MAQGSADLHQLDLEWQAATTALLPFLSALQDATRDSKRDFMHDLMPVLNMPHNEADAAPDRPLRLVQKLGTCQFIEFA